MPIVLDEKSPKCYNAKHAYNSSRKWNQASLNLSSPSGHMFITGFMFNTRIAFKAAP